MYDLSESKVDLQMSLTIHSFMTFKILFKPFDPEKRHKHIKAKLHIFKKLDLRKILMPKSCFLTHLPQRP